MKQKRLVVFIAEEDHQKLKSILSLHGKTISEWIRKTIQDVIREYLK